MRQLFAASGFFKTCVVTCLTGLVPVFFVSQASAAPIDITVIGTWESTNVSATINPFGLANGDRFVMKSTYDDTTLFNGPEGVTATVDPSVNPGTSLEVVIPHAGPAPNPLEFDHSDHTGIGFAPNAEIEFDGTDATTDPGVFRNFEIHVDFGYAGDDMDLDLFKGPVQVESSIFNISQGGNKAATGDGAAHLQVVTNDVTANAGGPYVFDASNLSLNTNGTSGGGNAFGKTFDWTGPGGAFANSPGANIPFDIADAGLVNTTDTSSITLVATELYTDFASAPSLAGASYTNAGPSITVASGVNEVDDSITFSATFDDADLVANALVSGFEDVTLEFLYSGTVFLLGEGNLDVSTLLGIFGGQGTFEVIGRVTDLAGASDSLAFDVNVVPEPGTFALVSLGLAGLVARSRRLRA